MCYKTYFNVVIVNNSHIEHVPFKYLVHFAEWFPARAKGYREGEHKLLCLEDVVTAHVVWQYFSSSGKYIKSNFKQET